jgi:hypothetical protein
MRARSSRAVTVSSTYSSAANGLAAIVIARAYAAVCGSSGTTVGADSQIFVAGHSGSATGAKQSALRPVIDQLPAHPLEKPSVRSVSSIRCATSDCGFRMACSNWPMYPPDAKTRELSAAWVNPAASCRRFNSVPKNSHAACRESLTMDQNPCAAVPL